MEAQTAARGTVLFLAMIVWALLQCGLAAADASAPRMLGIEGDIRITINRGDLAPRPMDDRTPLILRLAEITKSNDGAFVYNLHYIGFEPGIYQLKDFLIRPDGSPATEAAGSELEVKTVLPVDHDGKLTDEVMRPFPRIGGYRMLLTVAVCLWLVGLITIVRWGRKKPVVLADAVLPPPPTYADRLRPLVAAAAAGKLDIAGQAELERIFMGFWREKISLPEQPMATALVALKSHPTAGMLLRALENWLHRPGGISNGEIDALLAPCQQSSVFDREDGQ